MAPSTGESFRYLASQSTRIPAGPSADARSLRVEFDGTQNLYYGSVLQFVPAQPRTKYTFSAFTRSQAITTDAGVGVQISDAYDPNKILGSTDPLIGTTPWSEQSFSFETPPRNSFAHSENCSPPQPKV